MLTEFIDREKELSFLNSKFDPDKQEFVILYGRKSILASSLKMPPKGGLIFTLADISKL